MKYRSTYTVDAIQFLGTAESCAQAIMFTLNDPARIANPNASGDGFILRVPTPAGTRLAGKGDWIAQRPGGDDLMVYGEKEFQEMYAPEPVPTSDPHPIHWNPYNEVVQDHRDGTVHHDATNAERAKRGLPVPWDPSMAPGAPPKDLEGKICHAINTCSAENDSDTPDFILASFLMGCLAAWNAAANARRDYYDGDPTTAAEFVQADPEELEDTIRGLTGCVTAWAAQPLQAAAPVAPVKLIPLGPADVPHGSAIRCITGGDNSNWILITAVGPSGYDVAIFGSATVTWQQAMDFGYEILRPGKTVWEPMSKPA